MIQSFDRMAPLINLILQGVLMAVVFIYSCYQLSILCTLVIVGNFYVLHKKIFLVTKVLREKTEEVSVIKKDIDSLQTEIKETQQTFNKNF